MILGFLLFFSRLELLHRSEKDQHAFWSIIDLTKTEKAEIFAR